MLQLDYQKLHATPVAAEPYPHVVVTEFVPAAVLPEVVAGLPRLEKGGSFPTSGLRLGAAAKALMAELEGPRFRDAIKRKFGLELEGAPTMVTLRGMSREKDGRIHTDSTAKRVTVLDPPIRRTLESFEARLSEPAILSQLLQSLEEEAALPEDGDIGEVLAELRAEGLETMLIFLPTLKRPAIRQVLEASVDRLGTAHTDVVLGILGNPDSEALRGAVGLCRRLALQVAVPALERLVTHGDPAVRLGAVEALATIGSAGALTALERALDDSARAVRIAAVTAVMEKGYRGALRRLEAVVLGRGPQELERAERRQFFEAYAVLAGAPALRVLSNILEPRGLFRRRETAENRTCAAYAIARLQSPDARLVLERIQQDKELAVRNAAARALRDWPP